MDIETKFFPIFTCGKLAYENYQMWYCVFEKILLALDLCAIVFLIWQIINQGNTYGKYKGFKMTIYYTCLVSAIYVFVHYGIFSRYL